MSNLYEYYTDTSQTSSTISSNMTSWGGQTFTVGTVGTDENFNIEKISIYAYPVYTPGNIYASIRNVDGSGKPSGSDLCIGSTSAFPIWTNQWIPITMSTNPVLSSSTQYALCIRCDSTDQLTGSILWWRDDDDAYAGGGYQNNNGDTGSTWGTPGTADHFFQIQGITATGSNLTLSCTPSPTEGGSINPTGGEYLSDSSIGITANASPGYYFSGWSGDLTGSENPTSITLNSNKSITGSFAQSVNPSDTNNSFFVKDASGDWQQFDHYDSYRIMKRQNQPSEFEVVVYDIQDAEKAYFKEQAEVLFFAGEKMVLKGRIQTIEYGSEFRVVARGFGMESTLMDKEFIKSGDKRIQYDNASTQTMANEILSTNADGSSPWTMTPATGGIFGADYGDLTMRFEYANKLNALGAVANAINYEWWVSQSSGDDYADDTFNMSVLRGETSSTQTFQVSGESTNATRTAKEKDITNMANYVSVLGYGDGENQLSTTTYAASTQSSTLNANITSSASTSIALVDASDFDATGTARVAEEQFTYAGISTNTLTGCTRGANNTTPATHKKGIYVEQYFSNTSSQSGSSIGTYGQIDNTQIDSTLTDRETVELIASRFLIDHKEPIERIKVIPDEPLQQTADLEIGDLVHILDDESSIDDDYRIVGIEYRDEYGYLTMEIDCANVTLEFIEQMQREKEEQQNLQRYMQGSTDTLGQNEVIDCTNADPQYFKVYIPSNIAQINKVTLKYETLKSEDVTEHSGSAVSFVDYAFPTSAAVHIQVGPEGSETSISGSPIAATDGVSYSVDLTNEFLAAGVGDWVGVKLIPTGSDIDRMRIKSNIYARYFMKSEEEV